MSNLTPSQIIETLSEIGRQIDAGTAELERLDEQAVRARADYRREFARAFVMSDGSMDLRRYHAELSTESLHLEYELAEQKMRAANQHLKALRDRLEIGRSLGALIRVEWGTS
jgi:DNA-binding transcriptional regulator WhiA